MDPLSVIASITGIVAVAAKITTSLAAFIEKDRDAPKSIRRLLTELSDLRVCLDQLAPFIRGIKNAGGSRKDGISVEQVVVISTSLVLNISELDKMLDSFRLEEPMSTISRLRWTKNEEKVDRILTHICASKSSLNLRLTIFTWCAFRQASELNLRALMSHRSSSASTQAAHTSILNLTSAVEQILQTSEDVSRRVASIETRFATPIRYPDSTLRPAQNNDDTSTIISLAQDKWDRDTFGQSVRQKGDREEPSPGIVDVASSSTPRGQNSSREQHSSSPIGRQAIRFNPTLESELYASRVYSRNTRRHSLSSLFSAENSATGLSFLSGLSLAQISNLSVFSLPIFCHELWNPQQYKVIQNSGGNASPIAEKMSKLRKSQKGSLKLPPKGQSKAESTPSKHLYQILKSNKTPSKREINVLLLGAGESGKSTVRRQMQLLLEKGLTLEQRLGYRQIIFNNILVAFQIIFAARSEWGIDYESDKVSRCEQMILQRYGCKVYDLLGEPFPQTCLAPMKALFADEGFQRVVKKGNEFALHDNFQYYFKNIDSLFSPLYFPSDQDVLHTSMHTTGLVDTRLKLGKLDCLITDVGGDRAVRKEWVPLLNGVHCVIFTAPLSGYDQCLVEDKTAKQTEESLLLFDSILALTFFRQSTVILLLSKLDLFKEKISRSPISHYFTDYTGADDDSDAAQEFFVNKYLTIARSRNKSIRVCCTNLTDTDSFRPILENIEASIGGDHDVDGGFIGR